MLRRSLLEVSSRRQSLAPRITTQISLYLSSRKEFSVSSQPNRTAETGKPPNSGSNWTKIFVASIALSAAGITAYQNGYLDTLLPKEQNKGHQIPVVHQEPRHDVHDVEGVEQVAGNNVEVSEISSPSVGDSEKNVEIDPYYGRREVENQAEIKELSISEPHDTITDQEEKLPNLDDGISTSDNASFDSVETIEADPATKNQQVEPTKETHEGVQITSIPTEVAPVIEENVVNSEQPQQLGTADMPEDNQNDDIESNPLLDAYLIRDETEQKATPSTYVDKEVAEAVKGAHDVKGTNDVDVSNDGKLVLDFLQAIHAAEKRQADLDARIYSEEKRMMKEKYEKELKDARARELMYAERETILDKELHKEKLKAAAALKSLQEKLEEEFRIDIDRKDSETELELNKLKDLAKAELIAAIASEKASQIEKMQEANLNINALCMAFYARSEEARQSHSVHKLALGALALEDALSKGLPIQKEIDALNSQIDGIDKDSLLGLVMASLPEDTLRNGTDTILQLNHKFDGLKGTLRHFSLMPPGGGGILAHSLAYMASVLKVKEADKSGDGIESLMNRVESFLADGKLLEAAETLEHGLKDSQAAEVVRDWIRQARNQCMRTPRATLYEHNETPGGSIYWDPHVEGIPIPVEGTYYDTIDEALDMYTKYAEMAGFEIKKGGQRLTIDEVKADMPNPPSRNT
uniref:MICOS complex subunit MIC60 n=1 Tax=Tanacetum cinerariifolium TaxID=118510 RepID=A0A6L2K7K0_TANCI|nr:MICOS complex subunit MIC60 [Tanacetum cinerariifolium]